MKHQLQILLLCLFMFVALPRHTAQNPMVDSLKKVSLRVNQDSAAKLYIKIANIFTGVNSDSVRKYAGIAAKMATANSSTKGDALIQFGNSYHMENQMDTALSYFNRGLVFFTRINNEKGIAKAYQSFAVVKRSMSDYEGAISDSKKALEVYEGLKWNVGIVGVCNNISNNYATLKNFPLALSYSQRAFELSKTLNDSMRYFNMMMQLGVRYNDVSKPDSALYYLNGCTPYLERNNFHGLMLVAYYNIADAYWKKNKNTAQTKTYLYKSLYYSQLSGASDNLEPVYRGLAACYICENKTDSAILYFSKTLGIIDSLNTQKGLQQTRELQTKYETEKKELQIRNQALELDAKEKQNRQKSLIILLGSLALLGSGFFGTMAFISFRKTKKANAIIEEQKALVEEKQTSIIDSINYARRIQQAILTGEDTWNAISPEHFILFRPKDIVSGDFYWAYHAPGGAAIFALADCTGHGVPGGFMSMLGNSFLNEIVVENKTWKADAILNKLRSKIIGALEQKGISEQKDGMDISLCVWDKQANTLEFAGANNPMWLLRKGELAEYKADKMPIGAYLEAQVAFKATVIPLQKDDVIYLSTDGYADQFGGPKGKKFKYKELMNLLASIGRQDMNAQKAALSNTFDGWKGNYEQVDDVSIIGIRV